MLLRVFSAEVTRANLHEWPKAFPVKRPLGRKLEPPEWTWASPLRRKTLSCCTVMGYHGPEALRGVPCADQDECTASPTLPACLFMWGPRLWISTSCPDSMYHRGFTVSVTLCFVCPCHPGAPATLLLCEGCHQHTGTGQQHSCSLRCLLSQIHHLTHRSPCAPVLGD